MQTARASTRRAALAAFLLFAAGLFVVGPAEASRTTDARSSLVPSSSLELASLELSLLEPVEPADSASISSRFGFAEDLTLLDVEARSRGFELFGGVGTRRCALTYARNNPLKYVDPDGRAAVPADPGGFKSALFQAAGAIRDAVGAAFSSMPGGAGLPDPVAARAFGAAADSLLAGYLPRSDSEVGDIAQSMPFGVGIAVAAPGGGAARTFSSFRGFKRFFGSAGENTHWHHLVEQTPGNVSRFGAAAVQAEGNLMRVNAQVHQRISAFHSSIRPGITGSTKLTVRQWLSTQSYEAQKKFGEKLLRQATQGGAL